MLARVMPKSGQGRKRHANVLLASICLLAFVSALAACGADPTPTSTPTVPPPGQEPTASPTPDAAALFQLEWDALIETAKAEGELIVALSASHARAHRPVYERFAETFDIEVIITSGSGTDTANRILAERQAGAYAVDLMPTGSTTANRRMIPAGALDPFEPLLIHPEVTDKSLWFRGQYWWGDPEQKYIFIHGAEATQWTPTVWFNTDLVSQAEIEAIRAPADLFNPKWRGKVVVIPPDFGEAGGSYYSAYLNDDAGPEWIRTLLIEMEPFFSTDYRVMTDGIAQGKFYLGILIGRAGRDLLSLQDKGQTNIAELTRALSATLELTASGSSPLMMVANRPKNPAATQLFVNWFLSREGQMAVHELSADADQSLREDIPPGNINPSYLRQPGLEYQFSDADPVLLARFDEALKFAVDVYREAQGSGG